ncbi:MAG: nucleoside triphosphate pyrophosphohydrolase [Kiritimatiellia bacterium]|jgi:tetrapyrrole methylase family protein/MazG family protein|nr:nucleoside triphosphate pyrophosphohydrolase [Kiritimatiellia bacterium]MDP6848377.1 nucleoside triphosphate pyrophosphohydrolase [Kiritimatiellia bacterium]
MKADSPGIDRLLEVISTLRGPGGCPWDREQTLETLRPFLLEEAYELLDAIESGDADRHRDELGDVLLQVLLQSSIRQESGDFDFNDVADSLADKLVRRHPHVFGDVRVKDSKEVIKNWKEIKKGEKDGEPGESVLEDVPRCMPSLRRAQKIQSRASGVGFDWDHVDEVIAKLEEELSEVKEAISSNDDKALREEIGDLLFSVVNLSRFRRIDADEAMDAAISKFRHRFSEVERRIHESGRKLSDCTLEEMEAEWQAVKAEGR